MTIRAKAERQKRPLEHVVGPAQALDKPDMRIIHSVYCANAEFGLHMPFMVSPRQQKRAKALAEKGMLKAHSIQMAPNPEGWDGFSVTQAGIDAYNSVLRSNAG